MNFMTFDLKKTQTKLQTFYIVNFVCIVYNTNLIIKISKAHQGTIRISSKLGRFCCSIFLDVLFTMIMFENFIASERRVLKIDFN